MVWFLRVFGLKLRVDLLPFSVGLRRDTVQAGIEFRRRNFIIYSGSVVFYRDEPMMY